VIQQYQRRANLAHRSAANDIQEETTPLPITDIDDDAAWQLALVGTKSVEQKKASVISKASAISKPTTVQNSKPNAKKLVTAPKDDEANYEEVEDDTVDKDDSLDEFEVEAELTQPSKSPTILEDDSEMEEETPPTKRRRGRPAKKQTTQTPKEQATDKEEAGKYWIEICNRFLMI
jgi:hypothetical protein